MKVLDNIDKYVAQAVSDYKKSVNRNYRLRWLYAA